MTDHSGEGGRSAAFTPFAIQSTFVPPHREVARGRIVEPLPEGMFRVEIENGRRVLAHVADRLGMHYVRLVAGDEVEVELAERDRSRGRIRKRL